MGRRLSMAAIFMAVGILVSLSSCEDYLESTDEVKIHIPIKKQAFSVDSSVLRLKNDELLLNQMRVTIDIDSLLEAEGLEYLSAAKVNELVLGVDEPAVENLFFLDQARVTISDDKNFNEEIVVAESDKISPNQKSINLKVMNLDIARELRTDGFYLRIYGTPAAPLYKSGITMFVEGKMTLKMDNS